MWDRIRNVFSREAPEPGGTVDSLPDIPLIPPDQNPWGVPLLDVRPVTQTVTSTTTNPAFAANAVSFGGDDGSSFSGAEPEMDRKVACDLRYRLDQVLLDGALFLPPEMEYKWALYYLRNRIVFIRSWRRAVVAVAETRLEGDFLLLTGITGCLLGEEETAEETARAADFLIRSHALGSMHPAPVQEWTDDLRKATAMFCMSSYGRMAHFAAWDAVAAAPPDRPLRTYSRFHMAAARGETTVMEELLSQGVPVDLRDRDGQSPLHWALSGKPLEAADLLLRRGASIDFRDPEGATPLMQEVQRGEASHVRFLLERGADPDSRDDRGFNSLHRAAEMGQGEIVRLLLERGADPNIETQGHTALSFARNRGHAEVVAALRRAGAVG